MSETLIPPLPETRPAGPKAGLGLAALTAIVVGSRDSVDSQPGRGGHHRDLRWWWRHPDDV